MSMIVLVLAIIRLQICDIIIKNPGKNKHYFHTVWIYNDFIMTFCINSLSDRSGTICAMCIKPNVRPLGEHIVHQHGKCTVRNNRHQLTN